MKPEYTPLDKLSPITKAYKVQVTVKEKSPIRSPPNKKKFQKLVFEDDEGNSMKATLFEDECDHFKKVFEHKKKNEIANAPVRIVNPKFSSFLGECELTFGGMTKSSLLIELKDLYCQNTFLLLMFLRPVVKMIALIC